MHSLDFIPIDLILEDHTMVKYSRLDLTNKQFRELIVGIEKYEQFRKINPSIFIPLRRIFVTWSIFGDHTLKIFYLFDEFKVFIINIICWMNSLCTFTKTDTSTLSVEPQNSLQTVNVYTLSVILQEAPQPYKRMIWEFNR